MGKCKQKTHKSSKKVLNLKKSGAITYKKSGGNHKTNKDTAKAIRQRRNKGVLAKGERKNLSQVI